MGMNKNILRLALPAIIANVTIPLLGLLDTAIAGHMGETAYIGAIAVGSMMFNLIYWNFGFLRMGTSGVTAQSYGADDMRGATLVLVQSCVLALAIAAAIVLLQTPLRELCMTIIDPSPVVAAYALDYYDICVWGAPPVLVMMSIKGWLLGMQDSASAMMVSIVVNVLNIVLSLMCVYGFHMGFAGIAMGTLAAQYLGLLYSLWLLRTKFWHVLSHHFSFSWHGMARLMSVNGDIFVRSSCMMVVMLFFMAVGARSGDLILAVNALMMQLFTIYSYFLDGVAFAGEALVGRYYGAGDRRSLEACVRHLFLWGVILTGLFTVAYSFPHSIFALLTDQTVVVNAAMDYRWWCAVIPLAGMAAFVWDGVYIGLTATRGMLVAVLVATLLFFAVFFLTPSHMGNNRLWLAYITFLVVRSVVQTVIYCVQNPQIAK